MDLKDITFRLNNSFVYRCSKLAALSKLHLILKFNNERFRIPLKDGFGERNAGLKDSWFCELIRSLRLPVNSDVLDIGVNEGQSLLTFKSCYKDLIYWGFEPNPLSVAYVESLIKINNFENTHIVPVGLYSKSSLVKFYIKGNSDSTATISKELRDGYYNSSQVKYVPVFPLDELNLEIKNISFIKVDVEGAELDVIKGMLNTIKMHHPIIAWEVLDYHSEKSKDYAQSRANQLMDEFKRMNYKAYRIVQDSSSLKYDEITYIELKQWTPQSLYQNDYIFIPAGITSFPY